MSTTIFSAWTERDFDCIIWENKDDIYTFQVENLDHTVQYNGSAKDIESAKTKIEKFIYGEIIGH